MMPLGVAFVQETTIFREFGPLSGSTMRLAYEVAPKIGRLAVAPDVRRRRAQVLPPRRHRPAGACARAASRAWGDEPDFTYFGGNSELRGYDYLSFVGQNAFFAQRRAALPADRGDGDADRHARRRARDALRRRGRRLLRRHAVQVLQRTTRRWRRRSSATTTCTQEPIYGPADRRRRPPPRRTAAGPTASACRPSRSASRSTSTGRGGRCSTGTGKTWSIHSVRAAAQRVPPAEVHDVDWLRLGRSIRVSGWRIAGTSGAWAKA